MFVVKFDRRWEYPLYFIYDKIELKNDQIYLCMLRGDEKETVAKGKLTPIRSTSLITNNLFNM